MFKKSRKHYNALHDDIKGQTAEIVHFSALLNRIIPYPRTYHGKSVMELHVCRKLRQVPKS
jgi:hypothetical protein